MFENLLGNIKEKIAESAERKRVEKEDLARMQREVEFERRKVFQEEFKKGALEVAKARAKKDAASKSGLQKMRALNRLRNLNSPEASNPSNFFTNFSAYTQRNLAKREENIKRSEEMRREGLKIKEDRLQKRSFTKNG